MKKISQEIVMLAIDEVNEMLDDGNKIGVADDFPVLGGDLVDSLTFINLVSAIEVLIEERTGKALSLVNDDVLSGEEHPFASVGGIVRYVEKALSE